MKKVGAITLGGLFSIVGQAMMVNSFRDYHRCEQPFHRQNLPVALASTAVPLSRGAAEARLKQFLESKRGASESPAPEFIETKDPDFRESVRRTLIMGYGHEAELSEIIAYNRGRHRGSSRADDGLPPPVGAILDRPDQLNQIADGTPRSCLILADEDFVRYSQDALSGSHIDIGSGRPVKVAAEITFTWKAGELGGRKLVMSLNPQSGTYNFPYRGPKNEHFNTFQPLLRIVQAVWKAGIEPDEIVIENYGSHQPLWSVQVGHET